MLKAYGFSAVSPLWSTETDLAEISELAEKHDMLIQSIHAAYDGIALLREPEMTLQAQFSKIFFVALMIVHDLVLQNLSCMDGQGLFIHFPMSL